jgi:hypothetical protein
VDDGRGQHFTAGEGVAVYQDGTAQGQIGETSVGGRDKQGLAMGAVDIFSLPHTLRTLLYAPSPPFPQSKFMGLCQSSGDPAPHGAPELL